jgi:3,5-epimerase/4-reductase
MKVLIYGSKGWIGKQMIRILSERKIEFVEGTSRVDSEHVATEIDQVQPTHVISLIGRTHGTILNKVYSTIDYLEQEGKLVENIKDNLYSPVVLAILCSRRNIHYTYLGTGCIFKSEHYEDGFDESSLPNFYGSSYSIVKGFTDRLMHMYPILNVRIRMPIDNEPNPRNFITKIVNYEKICSVPNSMTVLPELLPYVVDMMIGCITETINLTNPGVISHNEILEMYKDIVDPSFTWTNFSQEEQRSILASDRSNNYLHTDKIEQLFPNIQPIHAAIRKCLYVYKESIGNI